MIYTSYFGKKKGNFEKTAYVSIAVALPKYQLGYEVGELPIISPRGVFGRFEGEDYKREYFRRLDGFGKERIARELERVKGNKENLVLLCHEKDASVCHRRMFAEWWEKETGEVINEFETPTQLCLF